jgi:hypothetical protein
MVPRCGVLRAMAEQRFQVHFEPQTPLPVGTKAVLVVEGVPSAAVPSSDQHKLLRALEVRLGRRPQILGD